MTHPNPSAAPEPDPELQATPSLPRRIIGVTCKVLLPLALIVVGVLGAKRMTDTPPQSKRRPQEKRPRLVEVTRVERADRQILVEASGTVLPARRVELRSQVAGRVVLAAPTLMPGGRLDPTDTVIQIEKKDYELALEQRRQEIAAAEANIAGATSRLAAARSDLQLEEGNQAVARLEFDLLGRKIDPKQRALVLRLPQLAKAKATVASAEAALASARADLAGARSRQAAARLDLERTTIRPPFPCMVESKGVDLGQVVATATTLATLVGTKEFWVEVMVPVTQLRWLHIPRKQGDQGSSVRIHIPGAAGKNAYRTGTVLRLAAALEPTSRMARLLVAVADPLALNPANRDLQPLLIGSYVQVRITGRTVTGVYSLPRPLLHDHDTLWVITDRNVLDILSVDILYRGRDRVLLRDGIPAGARLVTTDLATPVPGMPLTTGKSGESR